MLSHPSQEHDMSIYSIFCFSQYSFKLLFIWILHISFTFTLDIYGFLLLRLGSIT